MFKDAKERRAEGENTWQDSKVESGMDTAIIRIQTLIELKDKLKQDGLA